MKAKDFGAGLEHMKIFSIVNCYKLPCKFISVFAPNIEPWYIMDFACMQYGFTLIPLNDSLEAASLTFILNQTESAVLGLITE